MSSSVDNLRHSGSALKSYICKISVLFVRQILVILSSPQMHFYMTCAL